MDRTPPDEIEFVHLRSAESVRTSSAESSDTAVAHRELRVPRTIMVGVVVAGAMVIAAGSARYGVPLAGALCAFVGFLPILWGLGWLVAGVFFVRRMQGEFREKLDLGKVIEDARASLVSERIAVRLSESGLGLRRVIADQAERTELVAWSRVQMNRLGTEGVILTLDAREQLTVPASVFGGPETFDAFCLELQRHIWAAERAS